MMVTPLHLPLVEAEDSAPTTKDFAILKEIMIRKNTISVKTDKPTPYNVFKVGSPPRLVLELTNTENDWKKKEVTLKNNVFFSKVRSGQFQNEPSKITRIVIELKSPVQYETTAEENIITLTARKSGEKTADPELAQKTTQDTNSMAAAPTPTETLKTEPQASPTLVQAIPQSENKQPAENEETTVQKLPPTSPEYQEVPKVEQKTNESLGDSLETTSLFGRQPITLDFYDIDIRDLFKIISEKSGVNIVYGNEVSGNISIQLKDVPFKDAVDTILALKNYHMAVLGKNILQLMTSGEYDDYKLNAISTTKVFPINYAVASDVNTQLTSILLTLKGKGKTIVDSRTNSIIVTDTPEGIEMTGRLIADLDKPTPQVMIEAKIVQVSLGSSINLGITWGVAYTDQSGNQMISIGAAKQSLGAADSTVATPGSGNIGLQTRTALNPSGGSDLEAGGAGFSAAQGLGLTFGFVKDVVRLNAALSALQQKNKSKLLSNPKVATLNNQSATIASVVSEPYITTETQLTNAGTLSTQKVNKAESGINLTVTPTINADGRITMKINPNITSSQPTSIGVPKTTSQQANTTVIVKDGETFVIGGLISELESDEKSYIPILGSIPIIGHLFKKTGKSKSRAELLVFVTPKIIPY